MLKGRAQFILMGIFSLIFCFSLVMIIKEIVVYKIAENEYAGLIEGFTLEDQEKILSENTAGKDAAPSESGDAEYYDRLYEINHDLVCILSIPSLGLNYPVVQGPDNEKYLKYTFEGKKNPAGCLFMDHENDRSFADSNTYIYGHNMKDGSMFGSLKQMTKEGFDRSEAKAFITTKAGTCRYELEDVQIVDIESYKSSDEGKKDLLTLCTCWGNDKSRRLMVTFHKEDQEDSWHPRRGCLLSAGSLPHPAGDCLFPNGQLSNGRQPVSLPAGSGKSPFPFSAFAVRLQAIHPIPHPP